ncbi:MAG: tRNA lysidine(34) synthetase TilS [Bacteroidota bacterium]
MLQGFENFIQTQQLFTPQNRLLLALSGGADSVCLFHLLFKSGYSFSAAHCNFGLRGAESDGDEAFVTALCNKHQVPLYNIQFDTLAVQLQQKKGIQETARTLRYNWFRELMKEHNFDFLLTAHHRGDHLETILINLLRSSGIKGLHGIPVNENNIIRPLLFTGRDEIRQYLKAAQLTFREDSSNEGDDYLRNALRHKVTEPLKMIQSDAEQRFFESSQKVRDYEDIANELLQKQWKELSRESSEGTTVDLLKLAEIQHQTAFLYYNLQGYGFTFSQIEDMLKSSQTGKRVISESHILLRERDRLLIMPINDNVIQNAITISGPVSNLLFNGQSLDIKFENNPSAIDYKLEGVLYLNANQLDFPLTLRHWQEGDKIKPLGMQGYKKISDILTDKKVDNSRRKQCPVLVNQSGEVVALLPYTIHEDYKLHPETTKILSIHLKFI